jgi:putative transposase
MVKAAQHLLRTFFAITRDLASLASSAMGSRAQLAAENLFLRKQLALYHERRVKPRRADDATRLVLAGLSRFLQWRQLLVIVKPETLVRLELAILAPNSRLGNVARRQTSDLR